MLSRRSPTACWGCCCCGCCCRTIFPANTPTSTVSLYPAELSCLPKRRRELAWMCAMSASNVAGRRCIISHLLAKHRRELARFATTASAKARALQPVHRAAERLCTRSASDTELTERLHRRPLAHGRCGRSPYSLSQSGRRVAMHGHLLNHESQRNSTHAVTTLRPKRFGESDVRSGSAPFFKTILF